MEACGTAHHWGRVAQSHGHRVTLLPVRYVKPYLRGNKTGPHRRRRPPRCGAHRGAFAPVHREDRGAAGDRRPPPHPRAVDGDADGSDQCAGAGFFREHGIPLPAGPRAALTAVPALTSNCPRSWRWRSSACTTTSAHWKRGWSRSTLGSLALCWNCRDDGTQHFVHRS